MSSLDLRKLWKLHLVDHAILEIRQKAAALDPGKAIQREIEKLTSEFNEKNDVAKKLSGEQTDLELFQKTIDEKLKKIDKELYGGKVVNPREVEAFQKEIEIFKRQKGDADVRILELWELVPPAKEEAEAVQKKIDAKKAELAEYQKKVVQFRSQLEAAFKEKSAQRPALAKDVPPAMLSRYEINRQKHDGIGMAEAVKGHCSACGTLLPEKLIEGAKEGKIMTCESCHRILYASDGLI